MILSTWGALLHLILRILFSIDNTKNILKVYVENYFLLCVRCSLSHHEPGMRNRRPEFQLCSLHSLTQNFLWERYEANSLNPHNMGSIEWQTGTYSIGWQLVYSIKNGSILLPSLSWIDREMNAQPCIAKYNIYKTDCHTIKLFKV